MQNVTINYLRLQKLICLGLICLWISASVVCGNIASSLSDEKPRKSIKTSPVHRRRNDVFPQSANQTTTISTANIVGYNSTGFPSMPSRNLIYPPPTWMWCEVLAPNNGSGGCTLQACYSQMNEVGVFVGQPTETHCWFTPPCSSGSTNPDFAWCSFTQCTNQGFLENRRDTLHVCCNSSSCSNITGTIECELLLPTIPTTTNTTAVSIADHTSTRFPSTTHSGIIYPDSTWVRCDVVPSTNGNGECTLQPCYSYVSDIEVFVGQATETDCWFRSSCASGLPSANISNCTFTQCTNQGFGGNRLSVHCSRSSCQNITGTIQCELQLPVPAITKTTTVSTTNISGYTSTQFPSTTHSGLAYPDSTWVRCDVVPSTNGDGECTLQPCYSHVSDIGVFVGEATETRCWFRSSCASGLPSGNISNCTFTQCTKQGFWGNRLDVHCTRSSCADFTGTIQCELRLPISTTTRSTTHSLDWETLASTQSESVPSPTTAASEPLIYDTTQLMFNATVSVGDNANSTVVQLSTTASHGTDNETSVSVPAVNMTTPITTTSTRPIGKNSTLATTASPATTTYRTPITKPNIEEDTNSATIVAISVTFSIILSIMAVCLFIKFCPKKFDHVRARIKSGTRRPDFSSLYKKVTRSKGNDYSNPGIPLHYKKKLFSHYEVPRWRLTVDKSQIVGIGHCGKVYRGRFIVVQGKKQAEKSGNSTEYQEVAVKDLRYKTDETLRAEFFKEMECAVKIGRHLNIVNLLGLILKDELCMIMEYCALGSLDHCLRDNRKKMLGLSMNSDTAIASNTTKPLHGALFTLDDLVDFCFQICRGMAYISSKGIIHRDLATRNVLLDSELTAKICDFGMARDESEYTLERSNVPLPLKWMAPEAIFDKRFTEKSDVWSFGVVIWEIFTMGENPYAEIFRELDIALLLKFLQTGSRLPRPEAIGDEMFGLMSSCWEWKAEARPGFDILVSSLEHMVSVDKRDYYVDCDMTNTAANEEVIVKSLMDNAEFEAT